MSIQLTPPATTPDNNCVVLDASSPCGADYYGYPMERFIYPTYQDLVSAISSSTDPSTLGIIFEQRYGCVNSQAIVNAFAQVKYLTSFWCSSSLYYSLNGFPQTDVINSAKRINCTTNPTEYAVVNSSPSQLRPRGPIQCTEQCNEASTGLVNILQNPTFCPNLNAAGRERIARYQQICIDPVAAIPGNVPPSDPTAGGCIAGTTKERQLCGELDLFMYYMQHTYLLLL
jgi:hypothetical protein